MRHLLASIVTAVIAALLFVMAAGFAGIRSAQLTVAREGVMFDRVEPTPTDEAERAMVGQRGYVRNCANCHGRDGRGWDQYPPLATAGGVAAAPGGREYLIDLTLYGLASPRWGAPMPAMGHLHDVEAAAILNYVAETFGGLAPAPPIEPAEVAGRRGQRLRAQDVDQRRPGAGGQ